MRWAAALAFLLITSAASGQTKDARPLAESLTGEAKQYYDGAMILYADNDYDGALAKFSRAYDVSKDVRLLWNMATCEKGMRHYFRTYILVERYLKDGGGSLSMETVQRAEETKRVLRDLYSPFEVHVDPADAHVVVDGQPLAAAASDGLYGLDLGMHKVHVEQTGYEPQDRTVDVPGKTPIKIEFVLKKVVAQARLEIVSEPGAAITVDARASTGSWEGAVTPGSHHVRVTAHGKMPYEVDVDLAEGAHKSMLVPLKDKGGIPVWVWIGGGVLLATGAAIGIYFAARPSDEVPITGKLGTIELSSFR